MTEWHHLRWPKVSHRLDKSSSYGVDWQCHQLDNHSTLEWFSAICCFIVASCHLSGRKWRTTSPAQAADILWPWQQHRSGVKISPGKLLPGTMRNAKGLWCINSAGGINVATVNESTIKLLKHHSTAMEHFTFWNLPKHMFFLPHLVLVQAKSWQSLATQLGGSS